MTPREDRERGGRETAPPKLPETNPPSYAGSDYSFTLQAVMEMQKTIGQLTQAVTTLTDQQKSQATKLDKISHQVYAALVVILLIGALLTFFAKTANDLLTHRIEAAAPITQPQSPTK